MSSQIIIDHSQFDESFVPSVMAASSLPQKVGGYIEELIDTAEVIIGDFVIDATGSMWDVRKAVVEGYSKMHNFLNATSERRKFQIARTQFNTQIWEDHSFLPVINELDPSQAFPVMKANDYQPGGMTKLYEAVQWAIASCEYYLKAIQQSKAATVTRIVLPIVSDGFDNQSAKGIQEEIVNFVKGRSMSELWSFQFYGIADPDIVAYVVSELGMSYHQMQAPEQLLLADRMFKAMACGNDPEMEAIIANHANFTPGIGGLGFKPEWVMTQEATPEAVAEAFGTKISSSFVAASKGLFTAKSGTLATAVATPVDTGDGSDEDENQGVF